MIKLTDSQIELLAIVLYGHAITSGYHGQPFDQLQQRDKDYYIRTARLALSTINRFVKENEEIPSS